MLARSCSGSVALGAGYEIGGSHLRAAYKRHHKSLHREEKDNLKWNTIVKWVISCYCKSLMVLLNCHISTNQFIKSLDTILIYRKS
jgi:hypothetical protein